MSQSKAKLPAKRHWHGGPPAALDVQGRTTDDLCEAIANGRFLIGIAADWGVSRVALLNWIARDPDRAIKAAHARNMTGEVWDVEGEKALLAIEPDWTKAQTARAGQLAHHYRWRAAKVSVNYRDKMEITGKDGGAIEISQKSPEQLVHELVAMGAELGLPIVVDAEWEEISDPGGE